MQRLKGRILRVFLLCLASCPGLFPLTTHAESRTYPLVYRVTLDGAANRANVSIELAHRGLVKTIDFNLDPQRHSEVQANGELTVADGRAVWHPPAAEARLTLTVRLNHQRDDGEYDSLATKDWAIFRGDDLIPPARVVSKPGAQARATLHFTLPDHWTSVRSGWPRQDDGSFVIDNPERRFSRPTGWIIAGDLGTRVERLGDTTLVVSAPKGSSLRRMDIVSFVTNIWPALSDAFGTMPPKIALIGHGDPMWRGGLSGPNSLFLHADRPLVSENGTSPLVHELVHTVTRIDGKPDHDWIAEGLAEYYSFELLYRSGAITRERREKILDDLKDWGKEADTLIKKHSTGATTARAVTLFAALDREIQTATNGDKNLDHLVRALIDIREVGLTDLEQAAEKLTGSKFDSRVLEK